MAGVERSEWDQDEAFFAENMRRRREELGWSQADLARHLREAGLPNMHQTTVARLEKGERVPRLGEARGIAEVLQMGLATMIAPPDELLIFRDLAKLVRELEKSYSAVRSAAEELHDDRQILERELAETDHVDSQALGGRLALVRDSARLALESLTEGNALQDRGRNDEEQALWVFREKSDALWRDRLPDGK